MGAAPWWTERSPNLEISGWKLRLQDIDSSWRNMMTWHYAIKGSIKRTLPTTMPLSELGDSWLTPEALHGLEVPSSPSSSLTDPQPMSLLNHPNLCIRKMSFEFSHLF